MHTKPNRHTKKVHEMEHKRHFTKSQFHMAFYLSKDSSESEMSKKTKGKICRNSKQQKNKLEKETIEIRDRRLCALSTYHTTRETGRAERHLFNTTSGGFYSDVSLSPRTGPQWDIHAENLSTHTNTYIHTHPIA